MSEIKTKSIENIERRMSEMDSKSMRYQILKNVKDFKTSWIGLGQTLYTVWKDKLYKEWGYYRFEAYTSKEIGIRKATAMKLLKSYYFLEKEEPEYLRKDLSEDMDASKVPSYETVDALRLASKRKDLDKTDYVRIKKNVLESGKDARDVRATLTQLIREREELEPEEARAKKRMAIVKRLLSLLKSMRQEIGITKIVSAAIVKDTDKLINKLESEISS